MRRAVPFRQVAPNLVTLLALCAGLTAIRMGIEGRYDMAVAGVVFAAVLDAIDGRLARMLKTTSRFGAELDSLADFVSFGVAPAFLIYVWRIDTLESLGWIAGLVFAICAALRLARFNAALADPDQPHWHKDFFVGVPAPAGAICGLLPIFLERMGVPVPEEAAGFVALYLVAIGVLMVSRLPTLSGKRLGARIPRDVVLPVLVASVLVAALGMSYPFTMLAAAAIAYLGHLPLAWRIWQRRSLEHRRAEGTGRRTGDSGSEPADDVPED
nr:CDP-diacylglycerol--serine O-phosphatidyltransferase [Propylenella binzhouense]